MKKTIYELAEEIISLSKSDCTPLTLADIEGLALEITNRLDKRKPGGQRPEYSKEIYKAYEGNPMKIWICTECQDEPCINIFSHTSVLCRNNENLICSLSINDANWHQAKSEEIEMVKEILKNV